MLYCRDIHTVPRIVKAPIRLPPASDFVNMAFLHVLIQIAHGVSRQQSVHLQK
jgi:hypothetical protein